MTAEFIGTAFLLAGVVGSGIMASRLTSDSGLQLLQNAFATAALLTALILAFGPLSGGHFNPVVTGADWWFGGLPGREALAYTVAQISGGILGVATNVKDKAFMIKVADNVKIEVSRAAVSQVLEKGEHPEEEKK